MKKEKGFTLVELIAVIILLGIIALIAIPTVNELLKEARMSAFEDTAYGLVRAGTLYYQKQELRDEVTSNITFTFPEATGLEVSGKKPSSGTMIVDIDGNVQLAVSNGRYCARKGFKDSEITLDTDITNCTITTKTYAIGDEVYFNPVQNQLCSDYTEANSATGVKTGCMKWYIYKEDTSNYGLILDHNTTATVVWYEDAQDNSYGPITLMNQLTEDTTNQGWKVSADIIEAEDIFNLIPYYVALEDKESFKNLGTSYEEYNELLDAAFEAAQNAIMANADLYPTAKAVYKALFEYLITNYSNLVLPSYMYSDIINNSCNDDVECATGGYWTKSPVAGRTHSAWYVNFTGIVSYDDVDYADLAHGGGVRPVISLSKSILQ